MIARGDVLNLRKARILESPCQNEMTGDPISPQADRSETHSHLKRNSSFFGDDAYGPAALRQCHKLSKDCHCFRFFAGEMLAQSVAAAEMRLIPVGKTALASGTLPECFGAHDAVTLEGHLLAGCGDAVPVLAFTSV